MNRLYNWALLIDMVSKIYFIISISSYFILKNHYSIMHNIDKFLNIYSFRAIMLGLLTSFDLSFVSYSETSLLCSTCFSSSSSKVVLYFLAKSVLKMGITSIVDLRLYKQDMCHCLNHVWKYLFLSLQTVVISDKFVLWWNTIDNRI